MDHRAAQRRFFLFDRLAVLYIAGFVPVIAYCSMLHQIILGAKLEYLPLMIISTYSALGVIGSWLGFLVVFFTS